MRRALGRLMERLVGRRRSAIRPGIGRPAPWLLIGPALERDEYVALAGIGVTAVVDLREEALDDPAFMERIGLRWRRFPVPDHQPPTQLAVTEIYRWFLEIEPPAGAPAVLYVHCEAGLQRTPTVAAALLIQHGMTLREALSAVRVSRPATALTEAQEAWLLEFWSARAPGSSA